MSRKPMSIGFSRLKNCSPAGTELVEGYAVPAAAFSGDTIMTNEQKVIRAKTVLRELAKQMR